MTASDGSQESTPRPSQKRPWHSLMRAHDTFLHDLECITEMMDLVLPVLEDKDKERDLRIRELSDEIETDRGTARRLKSIENFSDFIGHTRKINRAQRMFRHSLINNMVANYDQFYSNILEQAYKGNPNWLKSNDKKLSYKEILEIESLDKFKSDILAKEIESLMRDSHYEQIVFLDEKLKIGIRDNFKDWPKFLEITERRNLYVHTGGVVSRPYLHNCKKWKAVSDSRTKEGVYLPATRSYIKSSVDCFYELTVRLAQAVARRLYADGILEFDAVLNNTSVELLSSERWDLAERIFEFGLGIPSNMVSSEMTFYFRINLCIALKFGGKDFKPRLHEVDWKPFHPKYHFAVAVLEDRFEEADILMRNSAVHNEVGEKSFLEWPLLREFRKTEEFQRAFREIFHKDLGEQLLQEAHEKAQVAQADIVSMNAPSGEEEADANNENDLRTDEGAFYEGADVKPE